MANNIGTQLALKIREIGNLHDVMASLAVVGTGLKQDADGLEALVNVFVFLEGLQNSAFGDLQTLLEQKVLPVVAHINDRV